MDIDSAIKAEKKEKAAAYKRSTSTRDPRVDEPPPRWGRVPPSEYVSKYGVLPQLDAKTYLSRLFANGPSAHASSLITRNSVTLLPGVYSFDRPVLEFQRELSEQLNKTFAVSVDKDGFTDNGVHTNFDRLRCPAGYFMNPMSYVPKDNALYRQELGLPADLEGDSKKIAFEVWNLIFASARVSAVNVAKLSTGGMRRFSADTQWKLAYVEWLMDGDRFERFLNAVASDDWLTLANEYEACFAMYLQKRGQVDQPGKDRIVFDLEYALTGGRSGKVFNADKRVVIDGQEYADFSAIRARIVQAGPWVINCFLQMFSTPIMRSMFDRFPSTFHVNTEDQIKAQTNGKYIFCSDVTDYDRSMSRDDIRVPHDVMSEVLDERIVKASWRLYTSPYYSKPLSLEGRGGVWVGDPRDWTEEIIAGNRSGHALTSLMAKVNKVIDTFIVINKIYPLVGRCKWYLEGKGQMGVVNNGDDEIVWAYMSSDLERFKKLRSDVKNGRYVVSPEIGQAFSGQLLVKKGETEYAPTAKMHTTFEKIWIPERSIGGIHKPFWPIGTIDRINNLVRTPLGQSAWDLHMKLYRDRLAPIYGDFMSMVTKAHSELPIRGDQLTAIDREVIEDPNKLHYKFTADEVSDNVLDLTTSKIPLSVVEKYLSKYYKGVLV